MIPVLLVLVALPLAIALIQRRVPVSADTFLTNRGGNGIVATACGVIAGNVGIGTFLAIHAFSAASPVIGGAVVAAYAAGLLLCAALAPAIRRRAGALGAAGLVDMIAAAHGLRRKSWIWVPVAAVFVLRAAVQLSALGLLLTPVLGGNGTLAVIAGGATIGLYLALGGYRAAVGTDVAQALVILGAVAVAAFGLPPAPQADGEAPVGLGPYGPALLIGIALFLPWSAVMAIDNWQRVTLAASDRTAQAGFVLAAAACVAVYAVIAVAGQRAAPGQDVFAAFVTMMPAPVGWLATVLFVACILSSIDTFIMALVTSLGPRRPLRDLRLAVAGLMGATVACTLVLGDVLTTVIAAFNGLTALLPALAGLLLLRAPPALAAALSVNAGFAATLVAGLISIETAAMAGFVVAALVYGLVARRAGAALPRAWTRRGGVGRDRA